MKNIHLILISFIASWCLLAVNLANHNGPSGPAGYVLDEYAYTQAARNFIAGTPTFNPEHPPVAKYFIAVGIKTFGDNPWGWRIASTLFGALAVSVMLAWVYELTGNMTTAVTAAALLVFNNFWFVMSRVALLPIFSFALSLVGLYCYTAGRKKSVIWLVASGIALGLALGCRWSALPVFGILLLLNGRSVKRMLYFGCSTVVAYGVGFLPLVLRCHNQRSFIAMNTFMWNFHKTAQGNPFLCQPWYRWVFRTQPWNALDYVVANPVITFFGLAAIVVALYYKEYLPVAVCLGSLAIWAVGVRPFEYYYYYLEAFSFLAPVIAIACWRLDLHKRLQFRPEILIIGLTLAGFIYHYGAMTALSASWDFTLFYH